MDFLNNLSEGSACEPRVGNVYPVKGGRGASLGHMMILFHVTEPEFDFLGRNCLMIVVNKDGKPVGVNKYGVHYVTGLMPIGFVDGIEDVSLAINPL